MFNQYWIVLIINNVGASQFLSGNAEHSLLTINLSTHFSVNSPRSLLFTLKAVTL